MEDVHFYECIIDNIDGKAMSTLYSYVKKIKSLHISNKNSNFATENNVEPFNHKRKGRTMSIK